MKSIALVCACAFIFMADGLPSQTRLKRQATSTEPASTSTTTPPPGSSSRPNNDFGIGAAAGIGGLGRSAGIGNFNADTRSDAFQPWGAFAGLNLGNGGRIGAGCSGLSCGVQLGQFVLATPQLLGIGRNFLNGQQQNRPDGKKLEETNETSESNNQNGVQPDNIHNIFRDAFQGFRETLASFFRAPVTHFIKKNTRSQIDNSTESVVGPVKTGKESENEQTFRIQLGPFKIPTNDNDNAISDSRA